MHGSQTRPPSQNDGSQLSVHVQANKDDIPPSQISSNENLVSSNENLH
jgi:hypothetical protein